MAPFVRFRSCVAIAMLLFGNALAAASPDGNTLVTATLRLPTTQLQRGRATTVAVHLAPKPGWHVYWKNSGDTGLATKLEWALPNGVTASDIRWPVPEVKTTGPLTDYVYDKPTSHFVDLAVDADAPLGPTTVRVTAKWLVCERLCVPGSRTLEVATSIADTAGEETADAEALTREKARLPLEDARWRASARRDGDVVLLSVEGTPPPKGSLRFLPWNKGQIVNGAGQPVEAIGNRRTLRLALDTTRDAAALVFPTLEGVLVAEEGFTESRRQGLWIAAPIGALAAEAAGPTLWQMFLFAFLGGLILNLMPCVFPVLSIKVLGFLEQAEQSPSLSRRHGWVFLGGVLVSFWALVAVLLGLRAAGEQLGWGFQLQSPAFVVVLGLVFFVVGLYFLGTFEVGGALMNVGRGLAAQSGYAGSFFSGVLATVAATPCTAPFMGSAVGFALLQPAPTAVALFTALAVGMGFPYVLFAGSPRLLRLLPRPGRWMESLKQALAFPLFATTIWLAWVLGQQRGLDAAIALLCACLFLGVAGWLLVRWPRHGTAPRPFRLARVTAVLAVLASAWLAVAATRGEATPAATGAFTVASIPYDRERIAALQAEGRPVFVDFTAAWCLTCKVNEKVLFSSNAVLAAFHKRNVQLMIADWTNGDERITRALAEFGRSGVPFYLLYPPKAGAAPLPLPELLTPGIVLEALNRAQ
jgi:thiol:disulfide interchange protein DsbD